MGFEAMIEPNRSGMRTEGGRLANLFSSCNSSAGDVFADLLQLGEEPLHSTSLRVVSIPHRWITVTDAIFGVV